MFTSVDKNTLYTNVNICRTILKICYNFLFTEKASFRVYFFKGAKSFIKRFNMQGEYVYV